MIIPTGIDKIDLKEREKIITLFYIEWNRNNPEHRVFNDNLNDYIYVTFGGHQKENWRNGSILHYVT